MRIKTFLAPAIACLLLAACVPVKTSTITGKLALVSQPAMRWDHRPEADEWTNRALAAVARHDAELAATVPADIEAWCPGYATASVQNRRAFWVGALSAVAKYESSWNPAAVGGGGKYIGVLQISPKSAAHHNCTASSAKALKDGAANLECGVEIMATQVGRDGVVAGKGNRGIGRDWMPFRKAANRAAMSEWTRNQSYCQ